MPVPQSWPYGYWNCANPSSPTSVDDGALEAALHVPTGAGRTQLSTVSIWVWPSLAVYNSFKNGTNIADQHQVGNTFQSADKKNTYVQIYETDGLGHFLKGSQVSEATAHELGHANNDLKSYEATSGPYDDFIQRDFLDLDYDQIGSDAAHSHWREPCSPAADLTPGPFVGVIDKDGLPICNGTTVADRYKDPTNSGKAFRNSYILQHADPEYFVRNPGTDDRGGWSELYAQSFAYIVYAYSMVHGDWVRAPLNGVYANGQFTCAKAWVNALKFGTATPPTNATCSTVISWYTPLVGLNDHRP